MTPILPWPRELKPAVLIGRRGRFTVDALAGPGLSDPVVLHLPNSGRLATVLKPGYEALYLPANLAEQGVGGRGEAQVRVTPGSLVLVRDPRAGWVSTDAGVPARLLAAVLRATAGHSGGTEVPAAAQALAARLGPYACVRTEPRYGSHRFDLALLDSEDRTKVLIECKSITLVEDRTGLFPDAPTVRGAAHVRLLGQLAASGQCRTVLVFVVGRSDAQLVRPHREMDREFGMALDEAIGHGLAVMACRVDAGLDGVDLGEEIAVR
ncbi:MAG: DNA/RNA nuclease SfsA [Bacillota bacterium]|nr:DNA/RNA nuclease SfsA [Bacillota bacterium]